MAETLETVSICSLGHESVWRLTSRLLPEMIEADSYVVYVPDDEVARFREITPHPIEIRPQSPLDKGFTEALSDKLSNTENLFRLGWYRQQLFKFQAMLSGSADVFLIWDADCVPTRKMAFESPEGNLRYMRGTEFHKPYFDMIQRLLGLERVQDFSFVTPGFPMKKEWMVELIQDIELANNGMGWDTAILQSTDFTEKSGFSETEILGTWVANVKSGEWDSFDTSWERLGRSRFGPPRSFSPASLVSLAEKAGLDVVSFENWDRKPQVPRLKSLKDRISRRLSWNQAR